MWLTDPSCRDVISNAWNQASGTEVVETLLSKVGKVTKELHLWNISTFGHVGAEIAKLETALKAITDADTRRTMLSKLRD